MTWRELYTDDGQVRGLFDDSGFQRVTIKPTHRDSRSEVFDRWGVAAVGRGGAEQLIRDGFTSEDDARTNFDFDHWSRNRLSSREDDELERGQ